jgi:hypothetical protein
MSSGGVKPVNDFSLTRTWGYGQSHGHGGCDPHHWLPHLPIDCQLTAPLCQLTANWLPTGYRRQNFGHTNPVQFVLWQVKLTVSVEIRFRAPSSSALSRRDHPPTHAYPTKIFSIFQNIWKILKTLQIIENTRNIANIALIFRICGVKVSKIQVERKGGLGGWWVIPF